MIISSVGNFRPNVDCDTLKLEIAELITKFFASYSKVKKITYQPIYYPTEGKIKYLYYGGMIFIVQISFVSLSFLEKLSVV